MTFEQHSKGYINEINTELKMILNNPLIPDRLRKAMNYSVFAGGKRLRPMLVLAVCDMLGGDHVHSMKIACGIELIHTYSLVHDDLPAIDNDDLRRGMPTSHKVFGEAMAVLVGDALLTHAFSVMLCGDMQHSGYCAAVKLVADCAGAFGMVAGQSADLKLDKMELSDDERVCYIHQHKTADMIFASVVGGALVSTQDTQILDALKIYANSMGLAFQIRDDYLDMCGSQKAMGKTLGKDEKDDKLTYLSCFGIDDSIKKISELTCLAMDAIAPFGEAGEFLIELARSIQCREN